MVKNIRNFIRNNDNIVLLVVDYYETKQIPIEMTNITENLALFPVANIPLIDYIIKSLLSKNLQNFIICGLQIKKIEEHLKSIYKDQINFISIDNQKNLGDIFRFLHESVYDLKDLLVVYANHYTNIDCKLIFEEHKQNDNLVTFFVHENFSNSQINHFYGTKDKKIVFYEKCINDKINFNRVKETIEKYENIDFNYKGSSPNLAVISPKVFQIFSDNFDFSCLSDFLESILAFNPFDLKIGFFEYFNLLPSFTPVYSREILTLFDYYRFNEDNIKLQIEDISQFSQNINLLKSDNNYFFESPEGFSIENVVLGYNNKLEDDFYIKDSSVGNRCVISGNIKKCIIWDDISITEDLEENIVFGTGHKFDVHYLEIEVDIEEPDIKKNNFFEDINDYLNDLDINSDIDNMLRQISLIKIVWNASNLDFIEAFVIFLINLIDEEDMEMSTINASVFFPLLQGNINSTEDQEELLLIMYNLTLDQDIEYRKQVLFRFGYLFIEDGIINKNVLKKYTKMIKKGIF
ncbi:translation initiation factor eIF-2B subunit epsilon (EIF2B5) [Vairimorpha necatrix]|uniref:Translation initiation factor eIF-2B subunit epsilon (EIF2B5) n=1 Tax=Vairimorpha necatrix TaxID=6039 RepID=A0AAX4JE80_9MICR